MRFNSVDRILKQLETQPEWKKFRQHRQLLKCWDLTVSRHIAEHTRPLYINRQILFVATNSAARAQELSFQRYALLKRLNQQLSFTLKDLRFSSSQWHQATYSLENQPPLFTNGDRQAQSQSSRARAKINDSFAPRKSAQGSQTESDNQNLNSPQARAKNAALSWLQSVEKRAASIGTNFCPKCQAIASKEELERWNLCHHCIATYWGQEYRPPTFPKSK